MRDVFRNTTVEDVCGNAEFIAEREIINNLIISRRFITDPEVFFESLETARKAISKTGVIYNKLIVKSELIFLKSENIKTYKLENYDIGFALKIRDGAFSEIIAMFNASDHSGIGYLLIEAAISMGGKYLECYGEELMKKIYRQSGFKVIDEIQNVILPDDSGDTEIVYKMELGSRRKEYINKA